jgi:signal transduction histidine kinase
VLLAAAVAVPVLMDAWWNEPGSRQADPITYALAIGSVLALLGRRRWPAAVAVVTGAALTGLYVLGHHGELLNLPVIVALYAVAVRIDRRTTVVVAILASAWSGVLGFTSDEPIGARGGFPVLELIWPLVPLAIGDAVRSRRELAVHAAADRERDARRRVEDERARMARDLHDVVAHTLAAVTVQMTAAAAAFDTDPGTARQALHQARASSRAAMEELRATVALARHDPSLAPAPDLDRVAELAGPLRAAGMQVTVHDDHDLVDVSGAVALAAYRVVQEALTNVVRHSDARHVEVSLRPGSGGLVVEVVDDGTAGPGRAPAPPVGGFGLIGMAERVRAVGGHVEHGHLPDSGFRVRAVLPTTGRRP